MLIRNKKIIFGLLVYFSFLFGLSAQAATFSLSLEKAITSPKDDIVVLVMVDSQGQNVNAAQAKISFPASLLEVNRIDRVDSVFSFWLEEPAFDNAKGAVTFVGGSTSGFTGSALKVFKIAFRVKGSGQGQIGVADGAITASDGSGSNVYNSAKGLNVNIPTTAEFTAVKLEQSTRQAELAKILPSRLVINVPFYPDPTKWYNHLASFQADWPIAKDISQAGIILDQKPSTNPPASADGLFGKKVFPVLTDGVWYLHLRLANSMGWGPTLHYRLAIDTVPPNSFKVTSVNGPKVEESNPVINFASSDTGSGLDFYTISVDGQIVAKTATSSYQLAPTLPGKHRLVVVASDKAGNATAQNFDLEILPIASPVITNYSRQVIVDEDSLTATGSAIPNGRIIGRVINVSKQIIAEQVVSSDNNGKWDLSINKALPIGKYYLSIVAQDINLKLSNPVQSGSIQVRYRPMLMIGSLAITANVFYLTLVLLLAGTFGGGWWFERWLSTKRQDRIIIAERDVANAFKNFRTKVEKVKKRVLGLKVDDEAKKSEVVTLLEDLLEESAEKMPYIRENISDIES